MQDIQSIQNLLTQVNLITKKYDEIAKHTGENYNIFQIIGKQSDELTHSKIIGDLLNPKGAHGLGDELLKEFLKIVGISNFETQNTKIEIEKHIGFISDDYSEGGRIDIFISNGSQRIIIENKIFAGDQDKQLERYHNAFTDAQIIYLTLWPKNIKEDCKNSVGKIDLDKVKIINATYSENITNWLKESLKHSVKFPLLRETLYQYLNLINILTEQSRNEDMNEEIINLLKNNANQIDVISIINQLQFSKNELINKTEVDFIEILRNKFSSSIIINNIEFIIEFNIEIEDPENVGKIYIAIKCKNINESQNQNVIKLKNELCKYFPYCLESPSFIGWVYLTDTKFQNLDTKIISSLININIDTKNDFLNGIYAISEDFISKFKRLTIL